jgi:hypothetical protein
MSFSDLSGNRMAMLRCLQGLLFLGVALFSLKWDFYGSGDKPFIAPNGQAFFTAQAFFEALPPWRAKEKVIQAGVLIGIGLYLWLTGEIMRWGGQSGKYSPVTFLALTSAKFAWHEGDPSGYYPPLQPGGLAPVYIFFSLLTLYYLIIGEVQGRRRGAGPPNSSMAKTEAAVPVSPEGKPGQADPADEH